MSEDFSGIAKGDSAEDEKEFKSGKLFHLPHIRHRLLDSFDGTVHESEDAPAVMSWHTSCC